jgi:hypothetical protein
MDIDWNTQLVDQLDWQWSNFTRPRLDGLTDEEYFWEPVPGCWSVRPRGESDDSLGKGPGAFVLEYTRPGPETDPVTTIAWRIAHLVVGVFGARNAAHFGGPGGYEWREFEYAGTAASALAQLDDVYAGWIKGVRGLGAEGLARPCGPAEGPYADASLAELVLHINREALHHGAEVALLRDLYRWKAADRDAL